MKRSAVVLSCIVTLAACEREERAFRANPAESEEKIVMSSISPGPAEPVSQQSGRAQNFQDNAYHMSEGKRLYAWYNCNGCHANGGGDSGPPLMDDKWIYGGAMENIVQTIREGRPNGMPSFRGKVPDQQVWQIASYVYSMSGNAPKSAAPARNDDMHSGPAENRRPTAPPIQGGSTSPSASRPE